MLRWGMVGGGEGSQIGPAHRLAARLDGLFAFEAGALDHVAARLPARPDILDQRSRSVRRPFDTIEYCMDQKASPMRRFETVRAEFGLTALARNLGSATTLVGIPSLIAAAGA